MQIQAMARSRQKQRRYGSDGCAASMPRQSTVQFADDVAVRCAGLVIAGDVLLWTKTALISPHEPCFEAARDSLCHLLNQNEAMPYTKE